MKETLIGFGIPADQIKECAGTGLVVDIKGQQLSTKNESAVSTIALRADMDGLPIPENNPNLDYKS